MGEDKTTTPPHHLSFQTAITDPIDLKLSGYDHMGHLRSLRRPTLTWSNLTSFVMTYLDHSHPIETTPHKLVKN